MFMTCRASSPRLGWAREQVKKAVLATCNHQRLPSTRKPVSSACRTRLVCNAAVICARIGATRCALFWQAESTPACEKGVSKRSESTWLTRATGSHGKTVKETASALICGLDCTLAGTIPSSKGARVSARASRADCDLRLLLGHRQRQLGQIHHLKPFHPAHPPLRQIVLTSLTLLWCSTMI